MRSYNEFRISCTMKIKECNKVRSAQYTKYFRYLFGYWREIFNVTGDIHYIYSILILFSGF